VFDDDRAIDTLATIWVKSVYWLPDPAPLGADGGAVAR